MYSSNLLNSPATLSTRALRASKLCWLAASTSRRSFSTCTGSEDQLEIECICSAFHQHATCLSRLSVVFVKAKLRWLNSCLHFFVELCFAFSLNKQYFQQPCLCNKQQVCMHHLPAKMHRKKMHDFSAAQISSICFYCSSSIHI